MNVPAAANILGTLGAICWSVQLIPQIVINYRRHHTTGLQPSMMLLWAFAGIPLGAYNIIEDFNIALRVQAQILTVLSLITWSQCYYYDKGWNWEQCVASLVAIGALLGAVEAALILSVRKGVDNGATWPVTLMAVLAAALLAAGVLRHYWDIYIHRTVRGISFIFVGIDAAGDLFSLISVVFQTELDTLGMVIYATELTLWIGVFICGALFNFAPWIKAKAHNNLRQVEDDQQGGQRGQRGQRGQTTSISLHRMPSSTSVFRTPGSGLE